jgi:hypothetical protein
MPHRAGIDLRDYLRHATEHMRKAHANVVSLLDLVARHELPTHVRVAFVKCLRAAAANVKCAGDWVEKSVELFDDSVAEHKEDEHG